MSHPNSDVILQEGPDGVREIGPFEGERNLRLQEPYLVSAIETTPFVSVRTM